MFKSIFVENFRGLHNLTIDDLGRVNLIVGENGVGKTSLLEAIWLLQKAGDPILSVSFDETRGARFAEMTADENWPLLFRNFSAHAPIIIEVGEHDGKRTTLQLGPIRGFRYHYRHMGEKLGDRSVLREPDDPQATYISALNHSHTFFLTALRETSLKDLALRFATVQAAGILDQLVERLRVLEPSLKSLTLDGGTHGGSPTIVADLGLGRLLPLPLLGGGIVHLLEILLAILNATSGVVLIDEVEVGLYHSNFLAAWHAIKWASISSNVQLFTTTHSWECIEAAIEAFDGKHAHDFRLHRLERDSDGVRAITLDRARAHTALDLSLEVR